MEINSDFSLTVDRSHLIGRQLYHGADDALRFMSGYQFDNLHLVCGDAPAELFRRPVSRSPIGLKFLPHLDNKRKRLRATEDAKVIVPSPKSIPAPTIPIPIPTAIHWAKALGPVDKPPITIIQRWVQDES